MQEIARNDQNERIIRNRRHGEMTNEALLDNIYKNANHANLASYIINSQKKTAVLAGLTSHESIVFQIFAIIHASPDAFTPFTKKLLFNYLTYEDLTLCNEMMQWVSWSNKSEKIPRQQPAIVMTKDEILESMDKDINSAGLDLYLAHFHN